MPRAAIYARISADREGRALGVGRQVGDCEALAARRAWEVVERYVDDDVSAYSGRVRPRYRQLLTDIAGGLVDAVVVWDLDRLHRQPRELEEFFEVCDAAGVRLLASVSGDHDLATDAGRFTARILGAVSRKESDDKSRRARRKHLELALAGKDAGGGTRPFGFEWDRRTVRESEAAAIRECARQLLAGQSLRAICSDLDRRGVLTPTGGRWQTQPLRRLLLSGRVSGQREHRGELVADAEWPAIITKGETARIRALFADPDRRTNRAARRYLLTGLVRCERCGERLVARPRDDGKRRYVCAKGPGLAGCGGTFIVADELEAFVVAGVLLRLDSPELASAFAAPPDASASEPWEVELDQATSQLAELATAYGNRAVTMAEWLAARAPIEARVTAMKRRHSAMNRTSAIQEHVGNAQELEERWSELPLSGQRAVVAAVVDHLVIRAGRRGFNQFDPGRVVPVWRA